MSDGGPATDELSFEAALARLEFEAPDLERFPALRLAREALEAGGAAPIVLNAANEVAVHHFLAGQLSFSDIPALVSSALDGIGRSAPLSIAEVIDIDQATRRYVETAMKESCT